MACCVCPEGACARGCLQDLYGIWEELGGDWAEAAAASASAAGALEAAEASPAATAPELSPQQLQLVQEHFDRVPVCPWPLLVIPTQ